MATKKKKKKQQQAVVVRRPSTEEVRKAIEDARDSIDSIGEHRMEWDGEQYVIRLSKRTKARVTYDPETGDIVLVLPDDILWRQLRNGMWDTRSLARCVRKIDGFAEAQNKLEWAAEQIKRSQYLATLPSDERQRAIEQENVRLSNAVYDLQNRLKEEMDMRRAAEMAALITIENEGKKIKKIKKKRADAEKREKKAREQKKEETEKREAVSKELAKTKEELRDTKSRNSRLAAENNRIKKGRKEPYKKPVAGEKGGKRAPRAKADVTIRRKADQTHCHDCGTLLGNETETRPRILEDVEDGKWEVIEYDVVRRWCPGCGDLRSTPIPNALPNQRFGNRVLAMLSFLKMIGVSYRKIEMIFLAFYNVHLSKKTIQEAVRTVSRTLTPEYEAIQQEILKDDFVSGDETTWRVLGILHWVWVIVGKDAVWYTIQPGRGIEEAKKMLPDFEGIVGSDSLAAWNHVGTEHQKCHLHYSRDLKNTLKENKSEEFQKFGKKLKQILWESHESRRGYDPGDDLATRKRKQRNLLGRLWYLMDKDYTDKDCLRYIKRLYREFYHLFCHVISGVDWHNNRAERAVRCFVLLRKVMFSNRSEYDHESYMILLSIMGTCYMRDANPLDYMVSTLSKPKGSPVELPRPPTRSN